MTFGILIDTVSIQQYIFSSNKLKENLGASKIVQDIFAHTLKESVKETFDTDIDLNAWKSNSQDVYLENVPFEVGFVGGGNALLFVNNKEKGIQLIKNWTRKLLLETPGIRTAVAIESFDLNKFKDSRQKLFKSLQNNKQLRIPQTQLSSFGITAQCNRTGFSAEVWNPDPEGGSYISSVAKPRINAANHLSDLLGEEINDLLGDNWSWSDDLSKLGQHQDKDSHIAIVHIDGNSMGDRFAKVDSLKSMRELAHSVEQATRQAFKDMLLHFIQLLEKAQQNAQNQEDVLGLKLSKDSDKFFLPIRPIILGGDDITFVCDGRLGIYLAKKYMEAFALQKISDQLPISSCAGIAITKSKYPFFRGYELAEALCKNAKVMRKEKGSQGSWLDFQLVHSATTDELLQMRENQYTVGLNHLLTRPYELKDSTEPTSLELALAKAEELRRWPSNKRKELRQVLSQNKEYQDNFMTALNYRGEHRLPEYQGEQFHKQFFVDNKTPYFDLIELCELYPSIESLKESQA